MNNEYLEHRFKKGEERKNHKYISRKWVNGRWVYTYEGDLSGKKDDRDVRMIKNVKAQNKIDARDVKKMKDAKAQSKIDARDVKKKKDSYSKNIPTAYQPPLKKSTFGHKKGYVNEKNGMFYEGSYEKARKKSYEFDVKVADRKAQAQYEKQMSQKKVKINTDGLIKSAKKVSSVSKRTVNKGKKKVAKILRKTANKLD